MNYDLDSTRGMAQAIAWTNTMLSRIKSGGVWMVPRSGTQVTVDHEHRTFKITDGWISDPSIKRVIKAAGWKEERND